MTIKSLRYFKQLYTVAHCCPQLVATGTLLLISGFLSFNGGSLGHITHPGDGVIVARAVVNTIFGGSGAAAMILTLTKAGLLGDSRWPFITTINATLIGAVIYIIHIY